MPWELFLHKGRPAQGYSPQLGVHQHGRLSLNEAAFHILETPSHVELLFDPQARRIGVRAVPPGEAPSHAYPVTKPEGGGRYVVVALAFTRHYGITGSRRNVFEATLEDGVLAATLPPNERGAPSPQDEEDIKQAVDGL